VTRREKTGSTHHACCLCWPPRQTGMQAWRREANGFEKKPMLCICLLLCSVMGHAHAVWSLMCWGTWCEMGSSVASRASKAQLE
jgi:hypothetical protein